MPPATARHLASTPTATSRSLRRAFHHSEIARRMRQLGNVSPLVSVEGNEIVSDQRRGKEQVYSRTMQGLHGCLDARLLTGVCTSLCQTNMDLLNRSLARSAHRDGSVHTWFHIYSTGGRLSRPPIVLDAASKQKGRRGASRRDAQQKPIIIIDAYYDGDRLRVVSRRTGFTHHISPWGDIEPCPVIQIGEGFHLRSASLEGGAGTVRVPA